MMPTERGRINVAPPTAEGGTRMEVLIVSKTDDLPTQIRDLVDPAQPLPPGAQFFETKIVPGSLALQFVAGLLAMGAGAAILVLSVLMMVDERNVIRFGLGDTLYHYISYMFAIGVAGLLGGPFLLLTIRSRYRQMKQQREGRSQTRYGIFLLDNLLISHNWLDTTIIPRLFFKGLDGRAVKFELVGEAKTFNLPRETVCNDQEALAYAIRSWASAA
jgi:hypothetical protein